MLIVDASHLPLAAILAAGCAQTQPCLSLAMILRRTEAFPRCCSCLLSRRHHQPHAKAAGRLGYVAVLAATDKIR